jgi:predicted dehydrogenase
MMMGDLPIRVHAESARRKPFWGGEDEAMIMLAYPGGRLASVHLSFNQTPLEDRKVLVFEKGTAVLEADRRLTFNGSVLVEPGPDEGRHYLDEAVEFSRQFREFVLATRGETNRAVLADEGVGLIRTLEAALAAHKSGTVVPVRTA